MPRREVSALSDLWSYGFSYFFSCFQWRMLLPFFFSFSQVQVAWSCAVTLWKEEQHPAQVSRPANKTTTSSWNMLLDLQILFSAVLRNAEGCEVQNCHSCVCHDQAEGRRFLVFSRRIRSYEGRCENFKRCRSRRHGFRYTNEASILYK